MEPALQSGWESTLWIPACFQESLRHFGPSPRPAVALTLLLTFSFHFRKVSLAFLGALWRLTARQPRVEQGWVMALLAGPRKVPPKLSRSSRLDSPGPLQKVGLGWLDEWLTGLGWLASSRADRAGEGAGGFEPPEEWGDSPGTCVARETRAALEHSGREELSSLCSCELLSRRVSLCLVLSQVVCMKGPPGQEGSCPLLKHLLSVQPGVRCCAYTWMPGVNTVGWKVCRWCLQRAMGRQHSGWRWEVRTPTIEGRRRSQNGFANKAGVSAPLPVALEWYLPSHSAVLGASKWDSLPGDNLHLSDRAESDKCCLSPLC